MSNSTFNGILSQLVKRTIEKNGPHTSEELASVLINSDEAYAVLSGHQFKLPASIIDVTIEYDKLFARDNEGRWHIIDPNE